MPIKPSVIRTKRLVLRAIRDGDREAMFRIFADDTIKKTFMLPDFDSREAMEKLFQRFIALSEDPERFIYGISLDTRLIGFLNETKKDETRIELGYVIHPDWQNEGCMTEALAAAVEALFSMGYQAVGAGFFEGNDASRRVMEKCGLRLAGWSEEIAYRGEDRECVMYLIDRKA